MNPRIPRERADGATLDLWWAVPGVLAGMPQPFVHADRRENFGGPLQAYADDLPELAKAGIGAIVSLLNIPADNPVYSSAGFTYHSMPIADGFPPGLEPFIGFLRFVREQR